MTTLTKEDLNKALAEQSERFDKKLAQHTERLEAKIDHVEDNLATMVANGFADIEKRLDVRERVDTLETKVKKLESALNLRL